MAFLSLRGRKMNENDRRSEPRFPVSFAAVAVIENVLAATLPSRGRLCDISTNGCSIEFPSDQSIEHDINSYMKIETESESAIIKSPLKGSIRNFSLKEGLLRIGLSFN
jgi:c-di-GMP-binding flagellar brake protein YcgR